MTDEPIAEVHPYEVIEKDPGQLRRIHGAFSYSGVHVFMRVVMLILVVLIVGRAWYTVLSDVRSGLWLILLSLIPLAVLFLWWNAPYRWEFNKKEISAYAYGKRVWQVPIDSITEARVHRVRSLVGGYGAVLEFKAGGKVYTVGNFDALLDIIRAAGW